jgi:hypothetical protein
MQDLLEMMSWGGAMRRHGSWLVVLVLCLAVSGCASQETPPMPVVTSASGTIPALLGTYGWRTGEHGVQSDAPVPDEFVAGNAAPLVPAGSSLTIDYGCEPDDLSAYQWVDHEPVRVELHNGALQLPRESGVYVYLSHIHI